jgi:Kdo2-lipid IVA lauroyltransferase/acyltransferase
MDRGATVIASRGLKGLALLALFFPVRWAVQYVPRRWALKLAPMLGYLHARWLPDQLTRQIRAGIRSVWGDDLAEVTLEQLVQRNLTTRYKHLIDSFLYQQLDGRLIERIVPIIEGRNHLDSICQSSTGGILLMSHFGSFGMLLGGLVLRGYRLHQIFTLTPQSQYRSWLWVEHAVMKAKLACWTHEQIGFEFWRPGKYLRPLYRQLLKGEILVLYGDGARGRQFVSVEFMGHLLCLAVGPFRIAARAQVPLIPAFILRQADDRHRIILEQPLRLKADDPAGILGAANAYAALLSQYVRTYPDQWFTWARLWRRDEDGGPRLELSPSTLDHTDFYIDEKD